MYLRSRVSPSITYFLSPVSVSVCRSTIDPPRIPFSTSKIVKDSRLKVQASVQGDQVRVSGKKRDDLQQIIALLRNEKIDVPLQFVNLRD